MAKYTVYLVDLMNDAQIGPKLEAALSTYPLYVQRSKEDYIPSVVPTREVLNKKLLNLYKYREIGFESIGRFLDELQIAMEEIMPYYNQLMLTLDQDYNMLYNVDYTKDITVDKTGTVNGETEHSENGTSTASGTDTSETSATMGTDGKTVNTATPQGVLNIPAKNIDTVPYADNVTFNGNDSTETGTTSGTSSSSAETTNAGTSKTTGSTRDNEIMKEVTRGNYGQVSYQSLIAAYRKLITNVEQDIINDRRIQELFMMIY